MKAPRAVTAKTARWREGGNAGDPLVYSRFRHGTDCRVLCCIMQLTPDEGGGQGEQRGGGPVTDRVVALVTGASRGIGKAIAVHLARAGFDVAVGARTRHEGEAREHSSTVAASDTRPLPGSLDATAALVEECGRRALPLALDLLDRASLGAAVATVLERWGRIDVLVNNGRYVGPGHMDRLLDTPVELLDRHLEANVMAPVILSRLVLPGMLERGSGVVINLASGSGRMDPPAPAGQGGWGLGYGMSKGALHRLAGIAGRGARRPGHAGVQPEPGLRGHRAHGHGHGRLRVRRQGRRSRRRGRSGGGLAGDRPRGAGAQREVGGGPGGLPGAGAAAGLALRGWVPAGTVTGTMAEPTSTRDLLLDAAARLYAERGVDNVSLAEIVRAAHQRNASAVHYHLGNRDEVLRALLARHVPVIAERRHRLLEQARSGADDDVRSATEAIVRPVTEFAQRGWRSGPTSGSARR